LGPNTITTIIIRQVTPDIIIHTAEAIRAAGITGAARMAVAVADTAAVDTVVVKIIKSEFRVQAHRCCH
jgi:hypothetical protein